MALTEIEHSEKACRVCGEQKSLAEFHRRKRARDGHDTICKPCNKAKTYAWRAANPQGHAEVQRAYRTRHPDRVKAATTRWLAAHPEHHSARMKRRWADPDERKKLLAVKRERRHRLRAGGGGLTREETAAILNQPCRYCGGKATELDHVVPVSRGGTHTPGNVVAACRSCNARKWKFSPDEWSARCAGR